jgi:hypothetical membrane protein
MHKAILFIAVILLLIDLIFGIYQRFVQMPKWIASPPGSFNVIRTEGTRTKFFWEMIATLYFVSAIVGLALNWNHEEARSHIIASLIFFLLATILNFIYNMKRRLALARLSHDESQNVVLVNKIKSWMRLTIVRDLLLLIAAGFISIAWNHV